MITARVNWGSYALVNVTLTGSQRVRYHYLERSGVFVSTHQLMGFIICCLPFDDKWSQRILFLNTFRVSRFRNKFGSFGPVGAKWGPLSDSTSYAVDIQAPQVRTPWANVRLNLTADTSQNTLASGPFYAKCSIFHVTKSLISIFKNGACFLVGVYMWQF